MSFTVVRARLSRLIEPNIAATCRSSARFSRLKWPGDQCQPPFCPTTPGNQCNCPKSLEKVCGEQAPRAVWSANRTAITTLRIPLWKEAKCSNSLLFGIDAGCARKYVTIRAAGQVILIRPLNILAGQRPRRLVKIPTLPHQRMPGRQWNRHRHLR